ASLTLLPAVLSRLGTRVNGGRIRLASGVEHRSERFAAWGERLWRRPGRHGLAALVVLLALGAPVLGLRTGMPATLGVPSGACAGRCRRPRSWAGRRRRATTSNGLS